MNKKNELPSFAKEKPYKQGKFEKKEEQGKFSKFFRFFSFVKKKRKTEG